MSAGQLAAVINWVNVTEPVKVDGGSMSWEWLQKST